MSDATRPPSDPPLIDALPDLVLLVQRDGTILDHGGGSGLPGLKLDEQSVGRKLREILPDAVADLIKRLTRRAISIRADADARFDDQGHGYEVRASVRGPDRALCVLRPILLDTPDDTITGRIRPQLDRRGFLERFKQSVSLAALCERPTALAVIQLEGIADIAQVIDANVAEQIMSTAILRLTPQLNPGEKLSWYLGQLSDSLLALVLDTADRDEIENCLGSVCLNLQQPIQLGENAFELTAYAGVAILGRDANSARSLLDRARSAATQARRSSSSKICFFTDTLRLRSLARLDIARELSEAVANGDIRLRYVGRHDLETGRLVAYVGYVRWIHSVRGEVRPIEFLRVAETTGLATALSRAVLDCLQEDFKRLAQQWDSDVRISFGALQNHILQDEFVAEIARLLDAGVVPAQRLELRISEKAFIARDPAALRGLARLGVQLVVDEVGRGLASLDALARAPIWGMQLDRAWVTSAHRDEVALKVCRAGISVASALGLTPIATGVDTEQQRTALLALGCRYGSGDLYENAVPEAMQAYRMVVSD
jgi:EAL domain-containing protein (putative c-di-GMP-specific phosphodiesterase class I)/GGDEF domain-containing protein